MLRSTWNVPADEGRASHVLAGTAGKAGVVKILLDPATERILGASIVGAEAGELIHVFAALMQAGATARAIVDMEAGLYPAHALKSEATAAEASVLHRGQRDGWNVRLVDDNRSFVELGEDLAALAWPAEDLRVVGFQP